MSGEFNSNSQWFTCKKTNIAEPEDGYEYIAHTVGKPPPRSQLVTACEDMIRALVMPLHRMEVGTKLTLIQAA